MGHVFDSGHELEWEMIFVQPFCDNFWQLSLSYSHYSLIFSLHSSLSIVFVQWKEREKKLSQKLYQMVVKISLLNWNIAKQVLQVNNR